MRSTSGFRSYNRGLSLLSMPLSIWVMMNPFDLMALSAFFGFQAMEGLTNVLQVCDDSKPTSEAEDDSESDTDDNQASLWTTCQKMGDMLVGLAMVGAVAKSTYDLTHLAGQIFSISYKSFEKTWANSISTVAIAQTIKSGIDFTNALVAYSKSEKTGEILDHQRREILIQGFKFVGYALMSYGMFPAAIGFLAAALVVAAYDYSPRAQNFMSKNVFGLFCKPGHNENSVTDTFDGVPLFVPKS